RDGRCVRHGRVRDGGGGAGVDGEPRPLRGDDDPRRRARPADARLPVRERSVRRRLPAQTSGVRLCPMSVRSRPELTPVSARPTPFARRKARRSGPSLSRSWPATRSGPSTGRRATASCYGELPIAPLVCQKWSQFVGATSTDFGPPPAWIPAAICLSIVPTFSRPMPHFAAAIACPGAFADWPPPPETASAAAAKTSI